MILYMMVTGKTPLHHLFDEEGEVFLGEGGFLIRYTPAQGYLAHKKQPFP